ncbi:hypothetical protein Ciccas_001970 [Cichlidogyrus casuarinus]|uniref:Uncharacterized protein n=1 Tax=Cichlidogyrus casuarinus TaxID=1844966 RepID=A0ABD2QLS4_9PLAT
MTETTGIIHIYSNAKAQGTNFKLVDVARNECIDDVQVFYRIVASELLIYQGRTSHSSSLPNIFRNIALEEILMVKKGVISIFNDADKKSSVLTILYGMEFSIQSINLSGPEIAVEAWEKLINVMLGLKLPFIFKYEALVRRKFENNITYELTDESDLGEVHEFENVVENVGGIWSEEAKCFEYLWPLLRRELKRDEGTQPIKDHSFYGLYPRRQLEKSDMTIPRTLDQLRMYFWQLRTNPNVSQIEIFSCISNTHVALVL